jgi:CRISPR-associated protein Cmr5
MTDENKPIPVHKTLEQERAYAAWGLVYETKNSADKETFKKYSSLVKGFPATINSNGLGQAVAYLLSKKEGKNAEGLLLEHLGLWLTKSHLNEDSLFYPRPYEEKYDQNALMKSIKNNGSTQYILATLEALAFLNYLRRFAAGLSDEPKTAGDQKS